MAEAITQSQRCLVGIRNLDYPDAHQADTCTHIGHWHRTIRRVTPTPAHLRNLASSWEDIALTWKEARPREYATNSKSTRTNKH